MSKQSMLSLRRKSSASSVSTINMFNSFKNYDSKKRNSFMNFFQTKFEDQQNPANSTQIIKKKNIYRNVIDDALKQKTQFNAIQNLKKSAYTHSKLIVYQKLILGVTMIRFLLNFCRVQSSLQQTSKQTSMHFYMIKYLNKICLCLLLIMRYVALFALKVDQKKLYVPQICIKNNKQVKFQATLKQFIFKSQCTSLLILQLILILLFQPYHFFDQTSISILDTFNQLFQDHPVNSLLGTLIIIRTYLIIRCIINFTIYSSPRCEKLCLTTGFKYSTSYAIKCILIQFPLRSIFLFFLLAAVFLAFELRLSQGLINKGTSGSGISPFSIYSNCLWCVFIIMTTVGYGDLSPKTISGMLVICFTAILGIIVSSLLIVGLQTYLDMKPNQFKALLTLHRIERHQALAKKSKQVLVQICSLNQIFVQRKNQTKEDKEKRLKQYFQNLRKIILEQKQCNKKLKSLIDDFSIIQQMNRLFQILRNCLKQLYRNQQNIQKYLQRIEFKLKAESFINQQQQNKLKNRLRKSLKQQTDVFLKSFKSAQFDI